MDLWLDAWGLALILLVVSALDWCWLRWLHASMLRVIYHKCVSMRCQHGCNAWGAKSGILHAHARHNHISPSSHLIVAPSNFLVFNKLNTT
jgi:hypothetical protein